MESIVVILVSVITSSLVSFLISTKIYSEHLNVVHEWTEYTLKETAGELEKSINEIKGVVKCAMEDINKIER